MDPQTPPFAAASGPAPLVICTRERPGRLEDLLAAAGLAPIHVPLISVTALADGRQLAAALDRLADYDWLVVTSRHGADRVAAAAAAHRRVALAAVGRATAAGLEKLAGRPVDIVPNHQSAAGLVAEFPPPGQRRRVLLAQGDRADDTVSSGLTERGYTVDSVDAYRTVLRTPTPEEHRVIASATAVAFASGSAAEAWAATFGPTTPPNVVAIGPTTAAVATRSGLEVTHIAADHSIDGLAAAVLDAVENSADRGDRSP